MRQIIRENTALRRLYYRLRLLRATAEADEIRIISDLTKDAPRTFVEFGFHPIEFNCVALAKDPAWRGLLVDGSKRQVEDARALWPERIKIVESFLTLDNLDFIRSCFPQIGLLSIDVDGNDYWFLKALIETSPTVISVEYNSTLGLDPITVPYDPAFDRHQRIARDVGNGRISQRPSVADNGPLDQSLPVSPVISANRSLRRINRRVCNFFDRLTGLAIHAIIPKYLATHHCAR